MSRVHYPDSAIQIEGWSHHGAFECDDAEVWIEGDLILISYFDDDGIVVLEGHPDEEGGWALSARSRPRRAFLKPMSEAIGHFAGELDEQGEVAVWRLRLGEPAER
jgi:hypothetical protein